MILENKLRIAIDLRILIEYEEVLKRQEFMFDKNKIKLVISFLRKNGIFINALPLENSLPDEDDDPFLEVAVSAKADYLITGNIKHFPQKLCKNISIVTPNKFLKEFKLQV